MNSKEVFSVALGLESPCQVVEVRLDKLSKSEHELHIYLDFPRGHKFLTRTGDYTTA